MPMPIRDGMLSSQATAHRRTLAYCLVVTAGGQMGVVVGALRSFTF